MKKLLSLVAAMIIAATSFSQQVREVTLTVLGTAPTEEQATLQALRSAIEQTFGTFVSSETRILNDQLIKDEIVSVSSGNVKQYKKLNVTTLPNKQISVTLSATISINKLVAFAQSKGSKAEFAGETFATNYRLMQLRASSTQKALNHMMTQLNAISRQMFDYEIRLGSQILSDNRNRSDLNNEVFYVFPATIYIYSNANSSQFYDLLNNTLDNLSLNSSDAAFCKQAGIDVHELFNRQLPISFNFMKNIQQQVENVMADRIFRRYSIREIANPSHYFYVQDGDWGMSLRGCTSVPKDYAFLKLPPHWSVCSTVWPKLRIRLFVSPSDPNRVGQSLYSTSLFISPKMRMTEVRTPIKLTKEQKKLLKKGEYYGPTYSVAYTNRSLVASFATWLPISQEDMQSGKFKGFEIVSR